jgi:hypothetical protein
MFQIFFVIILFLLFCKPDPLPKYETYLYKPTSKGVGKDLKEYINKIEVENNIDYSKNSNPTAYIPAMCYTKTASTQEQNGHQHRIHESQHPGQGGAPISHHQATVRLRESQIQGVAEKR